jgi:hypothetical protein
MSLPIQLSPRDISLHSARLDGLLHCGTALAHPLLTTIFDNTVTHYCPGVRMDLLTSGQHNYRGRQCREDFDMSSLRLDEDPMKHFTNNLRHASLPYLMIS